MAEKEERILITQWNINYDICPAPTELQCGTAKSCDDCKVGMSRQEAINRMAKGLFKVDNVLALDIKWSQLKKSKQLVYKVFAEAALNSLLENKK